jgi:hypothetical protein
MASFDPFVTPVDYVVLNAKKSPGVAKVTGATDKRKWDVQQGMYSSGAITIYRGREISHFTVTLTLTSAQDWVDWAAWRSLVSRPPVGIAGFKSQSKAMTIEHPWLAMLDIHEVNVEEVGQPEETDETGAWSIAIKFLEFRLPKPSFAKPDAAKAPKAATANQIKIAELNANNLARRAYVRQLQGESR